MLLSTHRAGAVLPNALPDAAVAALGDRIDDYPHVNGDDVADLATRAEVSWQVASVPHHASGIRMEVYGSKGTLVLTSKSVNIGPSQLQLGIGKGEMKKIVSPASYLLVPADMPQSPAVNVAQAYARYAALDGRTYGARARLRPCRRPP